LGNSIELNGIIYTSWQNYFQDKFAKSEKYNKINLVSKGDVLEELYESKKELAFAFIDRKIKK